MPHTHHWVLLLIFKVLMRNRQWLAAEVLHCPASGRLRSIRPSGTLRVDGCKIPPTTCGLLEHGYALVLTCN